MLTIAGVSVIGTIGAQETVSLEAETATIANAFYGTGAAVTPAQIAADCLSVTFTVAAGENLLTINLIAPDPTFETAALYQGSRILRMATMGGLVGTGCIPVTGR